MFSRCLDDKAYKQGLGMALECRRLDKIEEFITSGDDVGGMLEYCQTNVTTILTSKAFREKVSDAGCPRGPQGGVDIRIIPALRMEYASAADPS